MAEPSRLIVSTRAAGRDADLRRLVLSRGLAYRAMPATDIRRRPDAIRRLQRLLSPNHRFDWIVVTSRTSAAIVARAITSRRGVWGPNAPSVAAVGPSTAAELRRRGVRVHLVPAAHTGQDLADALLSGAVRRPQRVLWPRAANSRPDLGRRLRRAGVDVVAPVIYSVSPRSTSRLATLDRALTRGRVAAVCFFAPSAVDGVVASLSISAIDQLNATCVASIGPTTSAALRAAGIGPVVEPRRATASALGRAVVRFLGARRETQS